MKLGVVVVDDDPRNLDYLCNFLNSSNSVSWIHTAQNVTDAVNLINQYKPQLAYLDVELPEGTGFDIVEQSEHRDFSVIFITAHEKYALRAIKFSAIDYLLKPFNYDDVFQSLEKVKGNTEPNSKILAENIVTQNLNEKRIGINSIQGVNYLKLGEILRCEANGNYTIFHLFCGRQEVSSKPIKEYEELLEEFAFSRVHKSHLINLNHVKSYIKNEGGFAVMTDGSEIPISKTKKDAFLERMKSAFVD